MVEIEVLMREELRDMMKEGASVDRVDAQIDTILEKMDTVAVIVPEFGSVAGVVLSMALISIVVLTARSRLGFVSRI